MICKMATRYPQVTPAVSTPDETLSSSSKPIFLPHFSIKRQNILLVTPNQNLPITFGISFPFVTYSIYLKMSDSSFMMSLGFCLTPFWLCHYALMIQYMNYYNLLLNGPPCFKFHQHAKILNITAKLIFLKYHLHYVTHLSTKSGKNVLIFFKDLHN